MNPSRIYFKEIDIDEYNTFTANFAKKKKMKLKMLFLTKIANMA